MTKTTDVIVIGGGVAGLSTALQISARGQRVMLLERDQIGAGSTGCAAGLLGQLRSTQAATQMLMDGLEIVRGLEAQVGVEIFVETGSLRIAETPERAQEIRDLVAMGQAIDFPVTHVGRSEVADLVPYMRTEDLIEACYSPSDGHLQPAELVAAYHIAGRDNGVEYRLGCPVEEVILRGDRAVGVRTAQGEIHADAVVNAAGPWSYLLAQTAHSRLPTAAIGHYWLCTTPNPDIPVDRHSPAIRDRHHRIYSRPESGGLIVGMYEAEPIAYRMENLPAEFQMTSMRAGRSELNVAILVDAAQQRFPWIDERTPMTVTTGIMTFTPDGKPFCGRLPDIEGLFHCAGFSGHGIVQSPIIGVIMADLILEGSTKYDVEAIEADRYFDQPELQARADVEQRCYEMYAGYYGRVESVG